MVHVGYDGNWQGAVSLDSTSESVSGAGSDNIFIEGAPSTVSATAQKTDDWGYTLYLGLWYTCQITARTK